MFNTLIVDDNQGFRQSLRQVLVRHFPWMRIAEVEDGEEALHQAAYQRPNLVFMDIRLSGGNGLDVTRSIKSSQANTVVCIISSHDLPEYREAALNSGADHYFVKGEASGAEIASYVDGILTVRHAA